MFRLARPVRHLFFVLAGAYVVVLAGVVAFRLTWPFELEWMEGGVLTHALRLKLGQPIYGPPTADFVPFFYTPGYPMLLAGVSALGAPLGFALGRAVSAAATLATMAMLYTAGARDAGRACGAMAVCLYAALFRFSGAFFDLVRPDALALALGLGAALVARRARRPLVAVAAATLLVAAFFTKQTTAVLAPGIVVCLFARDRRLGIVFTAAAAVLGAACVWAYDQQTGGWFWFYVFQGHQGHRFLWRNLLLEYWRDVLFLAPILLLFPALALSYGRGTRFVALALLALLVAAFAQRASTLGYRDHMYYRELWYQSLRPALLVPPLVIGAALAWARASWVASEPLVPPYWLAMAAAGALASGLNHSTQWAYSNCFMPLSAFGALVVAFVLHAAFARGGAPAVLVGAAGVVQLVGLAYDPFAQIPSRADWAALALLERRISEMDAPLFAGSHPFLAFQKTGRTNLHQMSIGDVAFRGGVKDLTARLARGEWRTVLVDENTDLPNLAPGLYLSDRFVYAHDELFPKTGFRVRPSSVWRLQDPVDRALAPGITGNFESGTYTGWTARGAAFGQAPASAAELRPLSGVRGQYAVSSRSSAEGGALESAAFVLSAPRVTLLVAGAQGSYVRALRGDEEIARVQPTDPRVLAPRSLDLGRWIGSEIRVQIVDERDGAEAGNASSGVVVDDLRVAW